MTLSDPPAGAETPAPTAESTAPVRRRRVQIFRPRCRSGRTSIALLLALLGGVLIGWLGTLAVQAFILSSEPSGPAIAGPGPRNPDVVVTLSYDLIAALIQQEVDQGTVQVALKNIRASNDNGRLRINGTATVLSRDVSVSVDLEPHIQDGQVRATVHRARFGIVPVARNIEKLAEDPLNRQLAILLGNLPATLTSARITDAGLIATADVRVEELPFFKK